MSQLLEVYSKSKPIKGRELRERYAQYHFDLKIDENLVLWEVQKGAGMGCNPLAIFNFLIEQDRYNRFTHIWIINSEVERQLLQKEYAHVPQLRLVHNASDEYLRCLCSAKYLIDNVSQPTFFSKKEGQIVINTWHSMTIKTLGFDTPNGSEHSRNMLRSFMMTDILISPNPFMTKIFKESFKLEGVFNGKIFETGFPRVDCLVNGSVSNLSSRLKSRGVKIDSGKRVVLYAPTWRGGSLGSVTSQNAELMGVIEQFKSRFDERKYQLLIKPHVVSYRAMKKVGDDVSIFVPPDIDTNELLSIVDALITDYSSIFVDYLVTDRPIVFYIPNAETYKKERGVLFTHDELPGPVYETLDEAFSWVEKNNELSDQYEDARQKFRSWACLHDDGKATERAVAAIFENQTEFKIGRAIDLKTQKKKLLIYRGIFNVNGITTSLIAMLKAIDYEKYDVTLYISASKLQIQSRLLSLVPHQVRILVRKGSTCLSTFERDVFDQFINGFYAGDPSEDKILDRIFKRESRRAFGDANFDVAVDYSGYSAFWPMILRWVKVKKIVVWQHSDMKADIENKNKQTPLSIKASRPTVKLLKDIYRYADKIVSCSSAVLEKNRQAFATPETIQKFTYLNNLIDFDRINKGMKNKYCYIDSFSDRYNKKYSTAIPILKVNGTPRSLGYYADVSATNKSGKHAIRTAIPLPIEKNINFVSIGRYSYEKNHVALFNAFAIFSTKYENARLYVIGDGLERENYEQVLKKLDLVNRVYLTGSLKNPFGLASLCDCLVLPSHYEGMGLVALEARVMGLPAIISDFSAVSSIQYPDGQLIVGKSVDELHRGLLAFRSGEINLPSKIDESKYITKWRSQFELVLSN